MKEELEKAAKEFQERKFPFLGWDGIAAEFRSAFQAGAEWQSNQSLWISIEDMLPPNGDDDLYIALDIKMRPPGCGVCQFNPKTKIFIDEKSNKVNPTHWMFIPKHE